MAHIGKGKRRTDYSDRGFSKAKKKSNVKTKAQLQKLRDDAMCSKPCKTSLHYNECFYPSLRALYYDLAVAHYGKSVCSFSCFSRKVRDGADPAEAIKLRDGEGYGIVLVYEGETYTSYTKLYNALCKTVENPVCNRTFRRRMQEGCTPMEAIHTAYGREVDGVWYASMMEMYRGVSKGETDAVDYDKFLRNLDAGMDPRDAVRP